MLMDLMKTPGYIDPELEKVREIDVRHSTRPLLTSWQILAESGPVSSLNETTDIHALRETLLKKKLALTASAEPPSASIQETDHIVATRDGSQITVRTYHGPKSKNGPVLVVFHGGGWVLGGLENEALLCRKWCTMFDGVSINVDYRLAPEHKFPTAVHDCYDTILWTARNPNKHVGDLTKGFIVAGISAGANMAASCSHLARDDDLKPEITGLYLGIPSLLAPEAVPERWKSEYKSREENKDAPILNAGAIALFRSTFAFTPTTDADTTYTLLN